MDDIYNRQDNLNIQKPETVTIIGVGGVGSWMALDMALAGVDKVIVVDMDTIESHNLNRTPFKQEHVEMQKTTAMVDLITERRIDTEVVPVDNRIEDTTNAFMEEIADSVVIDCRDHASPLPDSIQESVVATAGYDGFEYTVHLNPDYESIFGDENTEYETVPSFVAPPQFLASVLTTIICSESVSIDSEVITSESMHELVSEHIIGGDQ